MFTPYTPTEQELDMLTYSRFLHFAGDRDDICDQQTLTGYLVRAIQNFDYFYAYSDSLSTWRAGETNFAWISKHINKIDDPNVRAHLSSHFNAEQCGRVADIFPWGKYVNALTPFTRMVFDGETHTRACLLTGLRHWIGEITKQIAEANIGYKVVYSDNYALSAKILKEGLNWFNSNTQLSPVALPSKLYDEIAHLGRLYKANDIKFTDLKAVFNFKVQAMISGQAEVILINNFYMMFTYNTKHSHY